MLYRKSAAFIHVLTFALLSDECRYMYYYMCMYMYMYMYMYV